VHCRSSTRGVGCRGGASSACRRGSGASRVCRRGGSACDMSSSSVCARGYCG